jgi:hypothetical protein
MRMRIAFLAAIGGLLGGFAVSAFAGTALSVGLAASASCSNADLQVSWINAGDPNWQFGIVTNQAGATIGGFGPSGPRTGVNNYTGSYGQVQTVTQPPGTIVGSYAWVANGTSVPTSANAIEFSVIFNCSTKAVLYSCFGAYGSCKQTAAGFIQATVPTMRPELLAAMALLLALIGAFYVRHRMGLRR